MKISVVSVTLLLFVCLIWLYSCGILERRSLYLDNHTYSTGHLGMLGESTIRFRENKYFILKEHSPHGFSEGEFSWVGKDSILLRSYAVEVDSTGIYYDKTRGFHINLSGTKIKVTRKRLYLFNSIFYLKKLVVSLQL